MTSDNPNATAADDSFPGHTVICLISFYSRMFWNPVEDFGIVSRQFSSSSRITPRCLTIRDCVCVILKRARALKPSILFLLICEEGKINLVEIN